jgi:tape measure domain-containing protein
MVATVGSISVDLAVKSAAFEAGFKRAGTTVERESARISRATAGAEKAMSSLGVAASRLGGAFAGALAGREIIRYADAWTEAGNKIAAAGQIAGRQGRSLQALNDIATETRSGLTETVDLYAKLLRSTTDVAKSELEVAKATEIVNKAFKAGGAAASEQAAGILQLSQALGSGLLQGDELRSLRENAPLLAQAIADEFGTTIAGLKDLGAAGELTSERVFKAILAAQGEIEAAFDKTSATIGDGLTRIRNAGTELIGTLSEVTGGAGSLSGELQNFAAGIERMSDSISKFASDPSVRAFFEDLLGGSIKEGSLVDQIRDGAIGKDADELQRDIAAVTEEIAKLKAAKDKLSEGDPSLGAFAIAISEAQQRLAALNSEMDDLRQEADDAAAAVGGLGDEINRLQDKTVRVNVITTQTTLPNVTSLGGVTVPASSRGGSLDPLDPYGSFGGSSTSIQLPPSLNRYPGFATGGYTGNAPSDRVAGVVHGGEFVFDAESTAKIGADNLEAIRRGVRGYETGGTVGTIATLTGGADVLSMIESNTYLGLMEIRRAVGYLDTLVTDEQATLAAIRELQTGIVDVGRAVQSASSSSFMMGPPSAQSGITSGNAGWYGGFSWAGNRNDTSGLYQSYAQGGVAYEPSIFGEAGPEAAVPLISGKIPVEIKGGGGSTMHVHYHAAPGNPDPSPRAMMEMQDRLRQTLRANPL